MIRRLALVGRLLAIGFAVLGLWTGYVAVLEARWLDAHPRNPRLIAKGLTIRRGDVFSADGKVLAKSVRRGRLWGRDYPLGEKTAHVVGYYSVRYGVTGLERAYNAELIGKQGFATLSEWVEATTGRRRVGNDLVLTVDTRIQGAAVEALGDDRGACVAIDPRTGAVLALVTNPRFDPGTVDDRFAALSADEAAPLLDRAIQGRYPPGSTYKVVTAAAALDSGVTRPETEWPAPASVTLGGGKVTNYGGAGYGRMAFDEAFEKSVNTVFAQVGVQTGAERFVRAARRFGLDEAPDFALRGLASTITDPDQMDTWELAWAACGQPVRPRARGGPLVTPLGMAMAVGAIANGGELMEPRLVERIRDYRGVTVATPGTVARRRAVPRPVADAVRDLMVRTVEQGSGTRARIRGVKVAGKTGTAELAEGEPHAWFAAFAPAEAPRVVVVIVVEHGGTGGRVAAPRARQVLEAALGAAAGPAAAASSVRIRIARR